MVTRDIRTLLERLGDQCTSALESSVGYCVNRGHYELRWEHLFLQFIDNESSEVPRILRHFGIDLSTLKKEVTRELDSLRTGNTGKPSFSPPLLETMELAWSIASLQLSLERVPSGAMLAAAVERGITATTAYADVLRPLNVEVLKSEYISIVKESDERRGAVADEAAKGKGGEEILERYCTDFTQEAREGKIDPILGRDDEIRQSIDILNRRKKNNPILVGEAGVGKTAIVEGIALRIVSGDVPDHLKEVTLWGLDLGLLQAGASVKGEFEKRLKGVIDAVKAASGSTVLFIDEAHTLIGAGGNAGQGDAANLLKPALARGELRTMAATTWSEYRKYFEKDPALARRFQLVKVEEPDEQRCATMLRGVGKVYEAHHGVRVTYEGIKAAVSLSHRYVSGRQLPDKAVDVLDTACGRVKMSRAVKPPALDNAERTLANAELELATLSKDRDAGIITTDEPLEECRGRIETTRASIEELTAKWEKEKEVAGRVAELQDACATAREAGREDEAAGPAGELEKAIAELRDIQGESPMVFPYVSAGVCAQVISDWTGIPVGSMVRDEAQTLLELESRLTARVIGQDEALGEVANTIRAAKTGTGNPDAPMGVFLFVGPSGVGKTECAMALADLLFGGEKFATVINMSEYQEKHTTSQLKGSPPGYVGYGEGGVLTEAVRRKPYSIVVLDEVEKAHLEVLNLFYQVFDKGVMRDGEGREISFRNTVIVMTSNLASDTVIDMCGAEEVPSLPEITAAIRPALSSYLQPALLGRCKIVPFKPLSTEVMRGVVALKLDKIAQRISRAHGMSLSCTPELVDGIAERCTTVEAGARNADTIIDQVLLPAISRQLLALMAREEDGYTRMHIGKAEDGEFEISLGREESEGQGSKVEEQEGQ